MSSLCFCPRLPVKMRPADAALGKVRWPDGVILLFVSALLFLPGLGSAPLWDDDETRFACVAREMLRSGDWVVPRDNGTLANKPAAFFMAMATSFHLFGESPFAARIFSALCGMLSVFVTWRTLLVLADRCVAFLASLALASSLLFVVESRAATMDAALFLALAGTMHFPLAAWWRQGTYQPRRLKVSEAILSGACAGAGILLKGLVALFLPVLVLWLFLFITGDCSVRCRKRAAESVGMLRPFVWFAAAAAVALPWHVAVGWQTGGEWLKIFYLEHHLGRVSGVMEGHGGLPFLQVPMLLVGLFPWSVFLPLAAWRCGREAFGPAREPLSRLAFVWLFVWVFLFSLSATQLPNYVLPAYPAACLMIASLCMDSARRPEHTAAAWFYAAAGGLVAGGAVLAMALFAFSRFHHLPGWPAERTAALVPVVTAILFLFSVRLGWRVAAFAIFASGAISLVLVLSVRVVPALAGADPLPAMIAWSSRRESPKTAWATYRFSVPSVSWLSGGDVRLCGNAGELLAFLHHVPGAVALVNEEALPELASALGRGVFPALTAQPLFRNHRVCLLDKQSIALLAPSSAFEVPRGERSGADDPATRGE